MYLYAENSHAVPQSCPLCCPSIGEAWGQPGPSAHNPGEFGDGRASVSFLHHMCRTQAQLGTLKAREITVRHTSNSWNGGGYYAGRATLFSAMGLDWAWRSQDQAWPAPGSDVGAP